MSVYKEFFWIINEIEKKSIQIYNDAADFGALTKVGDTLWNQVQQLVRDYGKLDNDKQLIRLVEKYETGVTVTTKVTGYDEFKGDNGSEVDYRLCFVSSNKGILSTTLNDGVTYNGYFTIEKI